MKEHVYLCCIKKLVYVLACDLKSFGIIIWPPHTNNEGFMAKEQFPYEGSSSPVHASGDSYTNFTSAD